MTYIITIRYIYEIYLLTAKKLQRVTLLYIVHTVIHICIRRAAVPGYLGVHGIKWKLRAIKQHMHAERKH
jgi:hypothetical protein